MQSTEIWITAAEILDRTEQLLAHRENIDVFILIDGQIKQQEKNDVLH